MVEDSTRRGFLRVTAGAAVGVGGNSGSDKPKSSPSAVKARAKGKNAGTRAI